MVDPIRPVFIGIAGGTGSGKSTIAANIIKGLPQGAAVPIDHDSYYRDHQEMSLAERQSVNYDHPDSLDDALFIRHLDELRACRGVDVPIYDFVSHSRKKETRRVEPAPVVIVEGILVFVSEEVRKRLEVKIFVDTDPDIRVMRRIRRDMDSRGRSFQQIREQYYKTVRPMHLQFVEPSKRWADIIIPEGGNNKVALEMVIGNLSNLLVRAGAHS